ncbi:MAG TPA: hypothetical protein VFA23_12325 [Dongiaceae bacterium]|nr:hypothetical protein [Dongiaceae bacterium]
MTARWRPRLFALSTLAAASLPIGHAMADVIDGDWCFPDGRRFSIRGPAIVTPAGSRTTGNYSRHRFSYVVPGTEQDAGKTVDMRLMNENTVFLWLGVSGNATEAPPQVWHRCQPEVSMADPRSTAVAAQE